MRTTGVSFERMTAFVTVVDTGSFTAAADLLCLTKSAISHAISALENELGVQLIQRSTRKLSITEAGEIFLIDCRALLDMVEASVDRARTGLAQPTGTLRLTSPQDSSSMVAAWIVAYREKYPGMRVEYVATDQSIDLIANRFDLALRLGPMRDSSLHGITLAKEELWVVASNIYLARRGIPKNPEELSAHEWISLSILPSPWTETFTNKSGKKIDIRLRGSVSVSSVSAIRSLVNSGLGISAFPRRFVQEDVKTGQLTRLFPDYGMKNLYIHILYPSNGMLPAKVRAFIDLCKQLVVEPF